MKLAKFLERAFWIVWGTLMVAAFLSLFGLDISLITALIMILGNLVILYGLDYLLPLLQRRATNYNYSPSTKAVRLVRLLFDQAEKDNCLDEVWNLVTALRGPDVMDEDRDLLKTIYSQVVRNGVITERMAHNLRVADLKSYSEDRNYWLDRADSLASMIVKRLTPGLDSLSGHDHFILHTRKALEILAAFRKENS